MGNQEKAILARLKTGRSITPIQALDDYGCFRLAAVIHRLRGRGFGIETETISHNGKRFARYWLEFGG